MMPTDYVRVNNEPKTAQLQIRLAPSDKAAIQRAARQAGMEMSGYVLSRVLSAPAARFRQCIEDCAAPGASSFALASLNSLLSDLTASELRAALALPAPGGLTPVSRELRCGDGGVRLRHSGARDTCLGAGNSGARGTGIRNDA